MQARDLYQAIGDRSGEADALYSMSLVASFTGDLDAAEQLARDARVIFEELGAEEEVGQVLMAEGTATWKRGDLSRTRDLWEAALEIAVRLEDRALVASETVGLAAIMFLQGDTRDAMREAASALDMAIDASNAHTQVFALDTIASFSASAEPARAVRLAAAAETLREAHGGGWTLDSFGIENAQTAVADVLTEEEIARAHEEGSGASLPEAVELAHLLLADLATGRSDPPGSA